jgi:hypothetical protein
VLNSHPAACPYENGGWAGNRAPSDVRGGIDAAIVPMRRPWFSCPRCGQDWEVRINAEKVRALASSERVDGWRDSGGEVSGVRAR